MKVAICGFRHGHMVSLTKHIQEHPDLEIIAVAEAEPDACRDYLNKAGLEVTHPDADALLADAEFDILAVGDYYAARGQVAIKGLEAGKHILADKPLCTKLEEAQTIRRLAELKGLSVFVALTNRYRASWQTARRLLREGAVGKVCSIVALGHHPLSYGAGRPGWYFERDKHGGTLNDILVHGLDGFEWLTGDPVTDVVAARNWNAGLPDVPVFQDAAQAMLKLANGAGVLADVSYKAPHGHPSPWVLHFWGTEGSLTVVQTGGVTLRLHNEPEKDVPETLDIESDCVQDLVKEINCAKEELVLTTQESLRATEMALKVQDAANRGQFNMPL